MTASAAGYTFNSPTGSCDDGLGQSSGAMSFSDTGSYRVGSLSVSGTKYTVQAGGQSFSLLRPPSPSASASGFSAPIGQAAIQYSAIATPLTISLNGQNTVNQALAGQQITATLNGISGLPTGTIVTSYTWSFKTGKPIKNWDYKAPGDGVPTQLVPLAPADLSQTDITGNGISVSSLKFYDQVAETVTSQCVVNLKFADGSTGSVTATSAPIQFIIPTAAWTVNVPPPYLPRPLNKFQTPGFTTDNATQMGALEWWDPITITDPTGFTGGTGGLAQIATPSRTNTRTPTGTGHATYTCKIESPPGSGTWVSAGTGLDGSFPYPNGFTDDGSGHDYIPVEDLINGYKWDINSTGHSQDGPYTLFSPVDAGDNGRTQWNSAKSADSFETWLMFLPPPSATGTKSTIWVPLQHLTWNWGGMASRVGTVWTVTNPSFNAGTATAYSVSPAWSHTIVNDKQHY